MKSISKKYLKNYFTALAFEYKYISGIFPYLYFMRRDD